MSIEGQQNYWNTTFQTYEHLFGEAPSIPALDCASVFKENNVQKILELGCGQGRDTRFFADSGFHVTAADYSRQALLKLMNLSGILPRFCDLRKPLPFADESFDACYSHMLFCMAFSMQELKNLMAEIKRILKPGGIVCYTVRHVGDAHYRQGVSYGENMYETDGFIVHFFNAQMIQELSDGFETLSIKKFEEGALPRKLFQVTMQKK